MTSPSPAPWESRSPRLTTADLPAGCDECGRMVDITITGRTVGGKVLADAVRDFIFCDEHATLCLHANPAAREVRLPQPDPVSTP